MKRKKQSDFETSVPGDGGKGRDAAKLSPSLALPQSLRSGGNDLRLGVELRSFPQVLSYGDDKISAHSVFMATSNGSGASR